MNRSLAAIALVLSTGSALADTSLVCPATSNNTTFSNTAFSSTCSSTSDATQCTTKAGVTYDSTNSVLTLPGTAGNFQAPPGADVAANVYFAAPADFDKDGWDDFVAADDQDKIYVMRNQTITCGTSGCTGSTTVAPTAQTIASSWWSTLSNVRSAAFRESTSTTGTEVALKAPVSGIPSVAFNGDVLYFGMTPMVAADFDGDGWPDFAEISLTYEASGGASDLRAWPNAARLFLNTKNCHLLAAVVNPTPCGIGTLCTTASQPANGACTGALLTSGTAYAETNLSCTTTGKCPYYYPTFATYDLKTGAAVSAAGTASSTPVTSKPGDFGPVGHPSQQMFALDFDGDGDIDILYGHDAGTCPGTLCTTASQVFYAGIDVWENDCAQSAQWNATTKSCVGHIPQFSHATGTCNGTSCNSVDTLWPSTAHNTTTIAPSTNVGFDVATKQTPAFAYVDIDNDGDLDLVVGSPGCCSSAANAANRLRIYRGTTNSKSTHVLDTANPIVMSTSSGTYPGFEGGMTAVFAYDFSGDGYPDIITGTDGFAYSGTIGGRTRYWQNSGNASTPFGKTWPSCATTVATCAGCTSSCNPSPTQKLSESCGSSSCAGNPSAAPPTFPDFDMGLMLDYDHDPSRTKDMVMTNGNTGNAFYIFPNRASPATVVACGSVASGTLDTPAAELTVSGACLTPTATVPAGTAINYSLSNDGGSTWQAACVQTSTGIYSTIPATTLTLLPTNVCCSLFVNTTSATIQWKAEMDSNVTTNDLLGLGNGVGAPNGCNATGTQAPSISNVTATYTYTAAANHYKAGVITSDGVSYVGSFTQPGNRGHFLGISADFGTQYWDAGARLDSQTTRNLYTASATGLNPSRIAFSPVSPPASLLALIGAVTGVNATAIVNWVLGTRFGVSGSLTRLGAIVDSTPAIIQKPFKPYWYSYLNSADRGLYDAFITAQSTRIPLVMVGAMDGFIHAFYAISSNISDARNGSEAWGYVPPYVAASMASDYASSCLLGICLTTTNTVSAYPDGSPALVDYKKSDGTIATAALIGDGQGGSSLNALDVTQTVTATSASANTVSGPTPMWSLLPGTNPGKAISKPGVARTLISSVETYVVVAGTGINSSDSTKGNVVAGYNLQTGALLWQYQMDCALTSDITIFETDDTGETGAPTIDGYADRAVFADACGKVYKINPGQNLSGGWMGNAGYGPIALTTLNGVARTALFSTSTTTSAIGGIRPIVGTIGARIDTTAKKVLFFGTGGLESFATNLTNEFYAVYAATGAIRNKLTGSCTAGRCQKFYGGVVLSTDTVYLIKSTDAVIGSGTCDFGTSTVQGYNLNTFVNTLDVSSVAGSAVAASAGPLFGDSGALYFATVSGKVERIGSPVAATAGASSSGTLSNMGASDKGGSATAFTLLGWREVL